MKIDYKITPDLDKLAAKLTGDVSGARRAGMVNIVSTVEARAIKYAPVKTSNLANTGTSNVNAAGSVGSITFTAPYAGYVHRGTGLYGPHKTKIVPKAIRGGRDAQGRFVTKGTIGKKALYWPGAAHPVRAVKGMKGNPFLLKAAQDSDMEKLFVKGAENFMKRSGGM